MSFSSTSGVLAGVERVRGWQEEFYRNLHTHPELSTRNDGRRPTWPTDCARWGVRSMRAWVAPASWPGCATGTARPCSCGPTWTRCRYVRHRAALRQHGHREDPGGGGCRSCTPAATTSTSPACWGRELLAAGHQDWRGTLVALFQPAEEVADGARGMLDDGLARPRRHGGRRTGPARAARSVGPRRDPFRPGLIGADSLRITVHGRGAHGSMPQAAIDPVVLAAMIVVRLQAVVSREIPPGEPAVLTVGSLQAGTKSNIIPDCAMISSMCAATAKRTRSAILDSSSASCTRSATPPGHHSTGLRNVRPVPGHRQRPGRHRPGSRRVRRPLRRPCGQLPLQTASEDFSELPTALGVPYTYWGIGGVDPETYSAPRPPAGSRKTFRSTTPRVRARHPANPGDRDRGPRRRRLGVAHPSATR